MDGGSNPQIIPPWYDRNPVQMGFDYRVAGAVPGVPNVILTYQVPLGRSAFLSALTIGVMRDLVPTTMGAVTIDGFLNPYVGSPFTFYQALIAFAAVWDNFNETVPFNIPLLEGDNIEIVLHDESVGGSLRIVAGMQITIFDA